MEFKYIADGPQSWCGKLWLDGKEIKNCTGFNFKVDPKKGGLIGLTLKLEVNNVVIEDKYFHG